MALLRAIGLMSGTSMDGIDVAGLMTDGDRIVERGPSHFVPYEVDFSRRIEAALKIAQTIERRQDRPGDLALLEKDITERHAAAVKGFTSGAGRDWAQAEVVGFHGQTVLHRPAVGLTVQLGDGPLLARAIGMPVIYDMRASDMAHGGQGAPLVPAYHAALARSLPDAGPDRFPMVFVNIGGIANITYVPIDGDPVAFDTGPGNALLDQFMVREGGIAYDAGGMIGSEGSVVQTVLDRYLDNAFFARGGPKSLDRNDFTLELAEGMDLSDGARTLAAVSARGIVMAARHLPLEPKSWVVCGGGRRNRNIIEDLKSLTRPAGAQVFLAEEMGLDGDATEAEAWAYLAVRSLAGLPLTFPTTTGCSAPVTGGVLARP